MDETQIKRVIEDCGYTMYTNDYVGSKGNGHVTTYIYAYDGRSSKRYLGSERVVAQMSEDALRAHIEAKFAQSAQK